MMNRAQWEAHWKALPESQAPHALDAAWRRYELVQSSSARPEGDGDDPSRDQFRAAFQLFLDDVAVKDAIADVHHVTLPANRIPWTPTGLHLRNGQTASTFAAGRVWRSTELDLWLRPQFALWYRVGADGSVFNSTGHTNTFHAGHDGELYVANQFPGQFGEPYGGRLASPLSVYEKAHGRFEILAIVWKDGVDAQGVMTKFHSSSSSAATSPSSSSASPSLLHQELTRLRKDAHPRLPPEWSYLWFLGKSSIYTLEPDSQNQLCMHCKPYHNVGILQKAFAPPLPFTPTTVVSWDWLITSLPSRLREDLTFTHDYLSVAFEFENGRDLTYTWSWELEEGFGYWCPLPAWADREYHIVIRSGTGGLGQWKSERRNLYEDYVRYVEEGREDRERIPKQVVRAWFIAGNRWQRHEGEMTVKSLQIQQRDSIVDIL